MKASGQDKLVYICTKLYNYNDKLQAEFFEEVLLSHVRCATFMPFRDSNENELTGENKTRIVYDADIERLNSKEVSLLAVLYDGICKDEGISFEIGYAYGKGIPIYIINTDFIWYAIGGKEFIFDPIIYSMATDYTHQFEIFSSESFKASLYKSQNCAFALAAEKIKKLLCAPKPVNGSLKKENIFSVFFDFGGGKYEYQRDYMRWLENVLLSKGLKFEKSSRFEKFDCDIGKTDIENLLASQVFVCLGDEVELNSGTAALIGLARSANKMIILYESSCVEIHGENGHRMKKNLMIDYSIDKVAKTKEQIIEFIMEEINVSEA